MSQDHSEFPVGLPVGFFYEDPEARRQRIEGAQPPFSSVMLPRLDEPGGPGLDYRLIQFPWEPWQAGLETQSVARAYASWLNDIAADRLAAVVPLLGQAGAPVGGLREDPARLARLGVWMQRAFPALAAPMIEQGFWPTTRGGGWAGPGGPSARIRRVIRGSWMRWWGASRTTWR